MNYVLLDYLDFLHIATPILIISIYVNGRIINDKSLNTIVKVAYRDLLFHDRFPQVIINIKCPFDWVDVNVHPMKQLDLKTRIY